MLQHATDLATLIAAIAAVLGSGAAFVVALKGRAEIREVHLSINGRLDELVELTKTEAHAAGLKEGREE